MRTSELHINRIRLLAALVGIVQLLGFPPDVPVSAALAAWVAIGALAVSAICMLAWSQRCDERRLPQLALGAQLMDTIVVTVLVAAFGFERDGGTWALALLLPLGAGIRWGARGAWAASLAAACGVAAAYQYADVAFGHERPVFEYTFVIGMLVLVSAFVGELAPRLREAALSELRARDQHLKLERVTSEFVMGVSHELRTPTAAIQGFAQLLVDRWEQLGERDRRQAALMILRESERLESLVASTLYLSRIEPNQPEPLRQVVHLDRLVRQVVEEQDGDVRLGGDWGVTVEAHPARVRELVRRLLSNAAAHASGPVHVEIREHERHVTIAVGDRSSVIPADWGDVAFRRAIRDDGHGGVGFDLPIAEAIVRAHGGLLRYQPDGDMSWVVAHFPRTDAPWASTVGNDTPLAADTRTGR